MWEIAGLWLLVVLAGIVLIACLLLDIRTQEEEAIQRARLSLTLAELQESIEGDLALGFDLPDNRGIPPQLDKALAGDAQLHAIDVVDRAGIALFSTDRGAVGEALQPRVAQAAAAGTRQDRIWSAPLGTEAVMGLPLHGPFGEVVGHISATYAALPGRTQAQRAAGHLRPWLDSPILTAAAGMLLFAVLAGWLAALWALRPQARLLAVARQGRPGRALARAAAVRQRMDDCLVRLDESERAE
ncbi:hypothetical protein PY257_11650 [Ramlibacter sp. H39-3-26]|uniref:hypothetical protein n=1 Tax=Curvibacter soli TaxID=3031331 RepID=UPI0023DAEE55|nr:hypothetical protein [Ramlibacter sp. H39-3-26]MDF1485826.1 hypothetical protein [Ramlibacter sp. H39-3-26]